MNEEMNNYINDLATYGEIYVFETLITSCGANKQKLDGTVAISSPTV